MADHTDERSVAEREEQDTAVKSQVFREFFAGIAHSRPTHHPVFDKFGSEHVTQFLGQAHEQDIEELRLRKGRRWFRLIYVLIGVAVFAFLTLLLLPEQANLYLDILRGLGIFAAGAGGGYGLKAYQDSRRDS